MFEKCPKCNTQTVVDTSYVFIRCLNCGWNYRLNSIERMKVISKLEKE